VCVNNTCEQSFHGATPSTISTVLKSMFLPIPELCGTYWRLHC
jgi:hypothetical protein